ncbi:MAG TPA: hypothetical protein VF745_16245 [Steroidobacteraceae bacterium]
MHGGSFRRPALSSRPVHRSPDAAADRAGKVWLQTLTVPNLAHALAPYLAPAGRQNVESGVAGGIAGAVLRDMFGNR